MTELFLLFIAFLLVLLNAFFVAAEFGMVKLRHTWVQTTGETRGFRGKILAKVHAQLDTYLSACQLGITLASLGLGWIGEPALARLLAPALSVIGIHSHELIKIIAFVVAFSLLSFFHIVVGELMPKSLAIRRAETISLWTAFPLYGFYWAMYPAIWFLNACSNFFLKIMHLDAHHHKGASYSTEEIKLILHSSHLLGELTKEEKEIIDSTLECADLHVAEFMRSREEMITLNSKATIDELLQKMRQYRFSRYPVFDQDKNDIMGVLHVKDFFASFYEEEKPDWRLFVRPVIHVSAKLPALHLLKKFREGGSHFALVYKNKRHLLGFVTLDNLLHLLIGRIHDEFHKTTDYFEKNEGGSYTVNGNFSISSLEKLIHQKIHLDAEDEITTLSGLILHRLGAFPQTGEMIHLKEFDAIVEQTQGLRLSKIHIYVTPFTKIKP
jgi:CBS domain containing-hemolysin-like protein